jgi:glycosyltransferase involved in cell wall biosynthesis
MKKNKISIAFEASFLANSYDKKTSERSGIYHCIRNILCKITEKNNADICLFSKNDGDYLNLEYFIADEKIKNVFVKKNSILTEPISRLQKREDKYRKERKNTEKILTNILKHIVKIFDKKIHGNKFDFAIFPMSLYGKCSVKANMNFLILYDMMPVLFPQNYPKADWFHEIVSFMSAHAKDKSWHYFAISENTKKDFLKHISGLPEESITVVPLAANEKFYPEKSMQKISAVKEKYGIPADKKYMLSLCSLEPRKNIITACKAFCAFIKKYDIKDLVFVLAGGHWDSFLPVLNKELEGMGDAAKNIMQSGYVDDQDMAALYSGAEWFVYTSQYEGFGLPPLEAMQCGTPVITSNNSSLPEVAGDAGIMVDYDSIEQHIKAYGDYYFNENLRKQNAAKGIERAKQFSWEKAADIILQEFRKEQ